MIFNPLIVVAAATALSLSNALPLSLSLLPSFAPFSLPPFSLSLPPLLKFQPQDQQPIVPVISQFDNNKFSGSLINGIEYEDWLFRETDLAFESVISNIGGYGQNVDNVLPGQVIASPSRQRPNYYYIWTRDAAISINSLITSYDDQKALNSTLRNIIYDYLNSSSLIQRVDNPSGTFESLDGLGEPKFMVDGSPFTGSWGRPQRDGPALRASTMMNFIDIEIRHNQNTLSYEAFEDLYNNVIRPDLDYVVLHWQEMGFDVWEEVYGMHFFTSMVQLKSLIQGSKLAKQLNDDFSYELYQDQAQKLRLYIKEKYWDPSTGHLIETLDFYQHRSGLDAALFLGTIHALDLSLWNGQDNDDIVFPPYSDEVVASLDRLVNDMRYRFPINARRLDDFSKQGKNNSLSGVGIGRYPEDVYDGAEVTTGNPWFLCTATVAQNLYLLADHLITRPDDFELTFADKTKSFYGLFIGELEGWGNPQFNISRNSPTYTSLVRSIVDYGDSFLDVIREHHAQDGSMSEQFSRYDGYMRGAEKLTWSYSAFWSASRQRNLTLSRFESQSL